MQRYIKFQFPVLQMAREVIRDVFNGEHGGWRLKEINIVLRTYGDRITDVIIEVLTFYDLLL